MGRKSTADWVVMHDGTKGDKPFGMECLHCGRFQGVTMPISFTCFSALCRAFIKDHKRCPKPSPH